MLASCWWCKMLAISTMLAWDVMLYLMRPVQVPLDLQSSFEHFRWSIPRIWICGLTSAYQARSLCSWSDL